MMKATKPKITRVPVEAKVEIETVLVQLNQGLRITEYSTYVLAVRRPIKDLLPPPGRLPELGQVQHDLVRFKKKEGVWKLDTEIEYA